MKEIHEVKIKKFNGMRRGVYILPNLLTSASLFSGFYSIIASMGGNFKIAAYAILVSAFFDSADGKIARLTRTTSNFGIEYDSLSDLVAFGVAPGILIFNWALTSWGRLGWFAAFLFVACGALRLARFNVQADTVEQKTFTGLPVPAAAFMIASTIILFYHMGGEGISSKKIIILLEVYLLALLMVSTIPYPSFKEFRLTKRRPFSFMILVVVLLTLIVSEPQIMLFALSFGYVCFGMVNYVIIKKRKRTQKGLEEDENLGDGHA